MPELRHIQAVDEIRQLITLRRKLKGLRQKGLSTLSGVSSQTISHFEVGPADLRVANLLRLLPALGLALYIGEAPKDSEAQGAPLSE